MAVSKRLRFEILRRDNHACRYCGATAPGVALTVDHVKPVTLGGTDEPSNLVAACQACNGGKSSVPAGAPLVDDIAADALRWAAAMRRAADITRAQAEERRMFREDWRIDIWENWKWDFGKQVFPLPSDWENSIDRLCDAGISVADFEDAVRIAMTSGADEPFRYMCGVLWNVVSARQEIATQILRGQEAGN